MHSRNIYRTLISEHLQAETERLRQEHTRLMETRDRLNGELQRALQRIGVTFVQCDFK